jgi:transposase
MANHTLVAVDLAKSVFEVAVSHHPGQVARQKRYSREDFPLVLAQLPPATVVMEACGSAHFWARRAQSLGHKPVLLPPHAVRPYVRRNKTDRTDTKGMLEAYRNEEIRPVPVKSVAQQTLASLHRLRSGWLAERTARINTLRGLLREFGILMPLGAHQAVPSAWSHLEDAESEIPDPLRPALAEISARTRREQGCAPSGRVIRLAPCARTSLLAPSTLPLHYRGRRYDCSPSLEPKPGHSEGAASRANHSTDLHY